MKHWLETTELLSQLSAEADSGGRAALATVIAIGGSAYRRPGAKLLVRARGATSGGVSGGCLEADVREHALAALESGVPRVRHYDTGDDDAAVFGLGLGCEGSVDVLVQPATTPAFLEAARAVQGRLRGDAPFAIATVLDGPHAGWVSVHAAGADPEGPPGDPALARALAPEIEDALRRGESAVREVAGARAFVEVVKPPPPLVVLGAGDDATPLVRYAREAGFRVALVDHRPAFLAAARSPPDVRRLELRPDDAGASRLPLGRDAYAIVKTHSFGHDRDWLRRLLATEVGYVGVLGPRARTERILGQLGAARDERVYAPVGLDLGAEGPEQVALAIVAELLAVRARRAPRHLRERRAAIHAA